jgi:hypothetical protein
MRLAERRAKANWVASAAVAVKPLHHKIYFGDGPWDQRACANLGYHFIGIGDRIAHPHRFDDFRDHQALLQAAGLAG